jgi:hypothetical protein
LISECKEETGNRLPSKRKQWRKENMLKSLDSRKELIGYVLLL